MRREPFRDHAKGTFLGKEITEENGSSMPGAASILILHIEGN